MSDEVRNQQGLEETKEMAGTQAPNIETVVVDITNREMIAEKKDYIIHRFGHLDGIINNAGIIQKFCHIKDMPFKDVERVMNINFYGTDNMVNAFLPYLCTRDEAYIVNVCSMGAFLPGSGGNEGNGRYPSPDFVIAYPRNILQRVWQ